MIEIPDDSIYYWMYTQGLKHVGIEEIEAACLAAGKNIREKDRQNYWNGWYNSDLYKNDSDENIFSISRSNAKRENSSSEFLKLNYCDYQEHPYKDIEFEMTKRWVPCSRNNKPLIPWSQGCMLIGDAVAYSNQVYLAENLKGTQYIVVDCDGDHGDELDLETMYFLNKWRSVTHCLVKPGYKSEIPESFHLTFKVDRVIPTMHFPWAHIDIAGNMRNQLRYWKNKKWNGLKPVDMADEWWHELQEYVRYRKENSDAARIKFARHANSSSSSEDYDQGRVRENHA